MLLKDYLNRLQETINTFAGTGIIITSEIESDFRSDTIGFVHGKIIFMDESVLFFREYIEPIPKIA